MGDFREQLNAIRPLVKKSDEPDINRSKQREDKKLGASPKKLPDHPKQDLVIARLPLLGKIVDYKSDRGFGFVFTGRDNWFFHLKGRISFDSSAIGEEIIGKNIVFILGISPIDGKYRAVQWCLADDINWAYGYAPRSQDELLDLRRYWYSNQPLATVLELLPADWYRKSFSKVTPEANLSDAILQYALIDKLKLLPPEKWRNLDLKQRLVKSLYKFAGDWVGDADTFDCQTLVNSFSVAQLVEFGKPKYEWFCLAEETNEAKLFEWALRSRLDEAELHRWESEIKEGYPWMDNVMSNLIRADWVATEVAASWIKKRLSEGTISADLIVDRVKRNPNEQSQWFEILPDAQKVKLLATPHAPIEKLVRFLEDRSNSNLDQLGLFERSIAVDIESDGEKIWEIGIAGSRDARLLLSRHDTADSVETALKQLELELKGSVLLIGHNILEWDWPILQERIPANVHLVIWDTLCVQFMLEPWKSSHALGSNHKAHDDARASFELFRKQLALLGEELALKILKAELNTTEKLLSAIGEALQKTEWLPPELPSGLEEVLKSVSCDQTIIAPAHVLQKLSWVKNIVMVSASSLESLATEEMVVDSAQLVAKLQGQKKTGVAVSAINVIQKAYSENISIRVGMLPVWVRENEQISEAIRMSLVNPKVGQSKVKIANYPKNDNWFEVVDASKFVIVDPPKEAFIGKANWLSWEKLARLTQHEQVTMAMKGDMEISNGLHHSFLNETPSPIVWMITDQAAKKLSPRGNYWREFKTIAFTEKNKKAILRLDEISFEQRKPTLPTRRHAALVPDSEDQAIYWQDILGDFISIAREQTTGQIAILLVCSSSSIELVEILQNALVDLKCGVPHMKHHSRFDQLVRASSHEQSSVVDLIENWPKWQSLAEITGVEITPVVEALPINEWYATWFTGELRDTAGQRSALADIDNIDFTSENIEEEQPDEDMANITEDEPDVITNNKSNVGITRIGLCQIRTVLISLIQNNLSQWLTQFYLSENSVNPVILDVRLNAHSKGINQFFKVVAHDSEGLTTTQKQIIGPLFESLQIVREDACTDYETLRSFFETHWNKGNDKHEPGWISDFREATQKPAIEAIRERSADVLVTLPTGEGKSVLFQVPALSYGLRTRRMTLVISPLRALMRDQVENLWNQGFHQSVDYLSADRGTYEADDVLQGVLDHRIVLLYVAPERFRTKRFLDVINRRFESDGAFEYVVVDEAHCINQWGYEFRPDYFYALDWICNKFRRSDKSEKTPFILLSATVTDSNKKHLANLIKGKNSEKENRYLPFLERPKEYFHPIRDHILIKPRVVDGRINVKPKSDWPIEPRLNVIFDVIEKAKENKRNTKEHSSIIVFVSWRMHAEELADILQAKDVARVSYYHAGLDAETRAEVYQGFKDGHIDLLAATKAFGMGMDIPHIHWAIHLAPPTYIEDYLQEVGRIGRGEKQRKQAALSTLDAVLLYSNDDFQSNRENIPRSRIEFPQINELYEQIQKYIYRTNGATVAILPSVGFQSFRSASERRAADTHVRKTLYWLERLQLLEIKSMLPALLPVNLFIDRLLEIANEEHGPLAEVAASLASICPDVHSQSASIHVDAQKSLPNNEGIVQQIVNGISNFVGFIFGVKRSNNELFEQTPKDNSAKVNTKFELSETVSYEAIVNLEDIWRNVSLPHIDDVLTVITDLQERNALKITRNLEFQRGAFSGIEPEKVNLLFERLSEISEIILAKLKTPCVSIVVASN